MSTGSILSFIKRQSLFFSVLIIFLSRLPFLPIGYGSEEDANGMALTARNIAQTGVYEYSRLPGHPVPELVYSVIYKSGPVGFNLLTALLSTLGILFFILALQQAGVKYAIPAGWALAFTPVVYIASTNAMDYTWAMAFILVSFYFLLLEKPALAGMALGLATGCRITSGGMMLPFLFLLVNEKGILNKNTFRFMVTLALTGMMLYFPLIHRYGFSFFDFYDQVAPSIPKALYKYTIALYGSTGLMAVILLKGHFYTRKVWQSATGLTKKLFKLSVAVYILYSALYWYLPQKSAFMIPAIPFAILFFSLYESRKMLLALTIALLISCFFLGINLSDPYRGGHVSSLATSFSIRNQRIVFDPVQGMVSDDYSKRAQRQVYASKILSITDTINDKTALIAGWWLGDILVQQGSKANSHVLLFYHLPENALDSLQKIGFRIYYLPEQDWVNDEYYGRQFTRRYAASFE